MFNKLICSVILLPVSALLWGESVADDDAQDLNETALITLLKSEAPPSEKAIACKKLAICGTSAAVPELSKLLPDPQLSSWARIALEVIPDAKSGAALRQAARQLDGLLVIGVIHSLGVRKDAQAVPLLVEHLNGKDENAAAAAAYSLGHIGNDQAVAILREKLSTSNNLDSTVRSERLPMSPLVRSALAEGCILCAEKVQAMGQPEVAVQIYDEVRSAELPTPRLVEATRGAILARQEKGIPLLLETLRSPQKEMQQIALSTIREFRGSELDQVLATEIPRLEPRQAALLIQAMADRPNTVVLSAVVASAAGGEKPVRLSALDALGRVGNASCLTVLLETARQGDSELSQAALQTLAILPGTDVDGQIVGRLSASKAQDYEQLLRLVGKRRIQAMDQVVPALASEDSNVRAAALYALGETVTLEKLPVLIEQVVDSDGSEEAEVAQRALRVASVRMPNADQCAQKLGEAMKQAAGPTQNELLEIMGDVGGAKALSLLASAAKSANPDHQDIASRLLGKWNGVEAAPVLLDLAKTAPADKYKVRALRGYIGIARKFSMPANERVKMCQAAMDAATRVNEQQLVLQVLKLHPSRLGLELVNRAKRVPELKQEAAEVAQTIEQKIGK